MRLWSIHPRYLDSRGLVALWREALLAKAVLRGLTRGYRHHPQLERFRAHASPRLAINSYLAAVHWEAVRRGYDFDGSRVGPVRDAGFISVTSGQLEYEWQHLRLKLQMRDPRTLAAWKDVEIPACHPLFRVRRGPVASWEVGASSGDS
jgi:hypothetical protein